ncbi:flagellar hook-basal body complex protein FliE [Pseudodesulfovibrio sediminis]|uniref:Flagellar hook-basal body complex protein FliE n=1 Tax=Pseudodesulfovibrio sediminis TaxID=2810563 RepID=A0ABM7P510_9BACT|nr:flagellar hook-basal body complex protein FliE [Pseudodesulfovibrio sediminis]BCS87881.1 flagellar hook-basal body complex protein FliE [Pseudodesulfovibrio sediminis]
MVVKSVAINAYQHALNANRRTALEKQVSNKLQKPQEEAQGFTETLQQSLKGVNDIQTEKKHMIEEFASGKSQNVHELMITMQKAGLTMQMTGAVRSKIMQSYKEIMQMQF